jgi:hypothetical protein
VVSVEALPSSDKLYRTRVQIAGGEERQVMQQYTCRCAQSVPCNYSVHNDGPHPAMGRHRLNPQCGCVHYMAA